MTDMGEFWQREVEPTLGDFADDYDADLLMDKLLEAGMAEYDPREGYRWTEEGREDHERYWEIVRECELA